MTLISWLFGRELVELMRLGQISGFRSCCCSSTQAQAQVHDPSAALLTPFRDRCVRLGSGMAGLDTLATSGCHDLVLGLAKCR